MQAFAPRPFLFIVASYKGKTKLFHINMDFLATMRASDCGGIFS